MAINTNILKAYAPEARRAFIAAAVTGCKYMLQVGQLKCLLVHYTGVQVVQAIVLAANNIAIRVVGNHHAIIIHVSLGM